jgi:hypothetical protein
MKWCWYCLLIIMVLFAGPAWVLSSGQLDMNTHWKKADRSRVGLAPLPADHPAALVQIYAARAYNWRGAFAVHLWIATKPKKAVQYTIYQVSGWNLYRQRSSLSITHGQPDKRWFGNKPRVVDQLSGRIAERAILKIKQAISQYPYKTRYVTWPGPNSNTFVAYVIRKVPELSADLPTTAIGKDYLVGGLWAKTPSGARAYSFL